MFLVLLIRIFLGIVFLLSGLGKLRQFTAFKKAVVDYRILPIRLARIYALCLPWIELAVGLLFLLNLALHLALFITFFLLIGFVVALVVNLRANRLLKCHCYGLLGHNQISWGTVIRNLILLTLTSILVYLAPNILTWSQWLNNWQHDLLLLSSVDSLLLTCFILAFGFVALVLIEQVLSLGKEYL
jgi:hypothetical protein